MNNDAISTLLAELNDRLASGPAFETPPAPEGVRCVLVTGLPRSGTTLATQLVGRHTRCRVLDNIAARFWEAPHIGIAVSRSVLGDDTTPGVSSRYGGTPLPHDPHEFGGFWRSRLGDAWESPEAEPRTGFERQLASDFVAMHAVAGVPVILKCFSTAWILPRLIEQGHRGFALLRVRRDPICVADSILRAREATGRTWFGPRPAGWVGVREWPADLQVAWQVLALEHLADNLSLPEDVGNDEVTLDRLTTEPRAALEDMASSLGLTVAPPPGGATVPTPRRDEPRRRERSAWERTFEEARERSPAQSGDSPR